MNPSAVLREAWELYRAHWRHFLPLAFAVYVVLGLISLVLAIVLGLFGALLATLISFVGVFWLQGALAVAVADVRDGRADLSLSETLARVRPRLGSLVGAGILAGLGVALGFVLLIVPGLYLLTIWSLIIPVVVLEGRPALESFGRSRALVRGNGWNVFGVIVLTVLVLIVFAIVFGILAAIALGWLPDEASGYIQNVVSSTLTAPFLALAWTLMYFRLHEASGAAEPLPAAP